MTVSYTITWEDRLKDYNSPSSLHKCPLCDINYRIDREDPFEEDPIEGDYLVTDNCECHTEHQQ